MDRFPRFHPPTLDRLVTIRNPSDEPAVVTDRYGRATPPTWGSEVYANKRDRAPYTSYEEGVTVHVGTTVWTIRHRENVAADVEVVDRDGNVYESIGKPLERGGYNGGRRTRYLEIHTTLRA